MQEPKMKNNKKDKSKDNNVSKTDLPDMKTNSQTTNSGKSMKEKLGGNISATRSTQLRATILVTAVMVTTKRPLKAITVSRKS